MSDTMKDIESRKSEFKKEFDALDEEKRKNLDERRKIDTRVNEITTRQVFLKGAYTALESLEVKITGKPVIVKAP